MLNISCSYWAYKSSWSMDGLPGLKRGLAAGKKFHVAPIEKMVGPLAPKRYSSGYGFSVLQVLLIALLAFFAGLAVAVYGRTAADFIKYGVKDSPLELKVGNWTQLASREGLIGLWSTH